jgi:hypothetical protein
LEKNLKGSLPPAAVDEDATRRKGHLSVEGHPSGATAEGIPRSLESNKRLMGSMMLDRLDIEESSLRNSRPF